MYYLYACVGFFYSARMLRRSEKVWFSLWMECFDTEREKRLLYTQCSVENKKKLCVRRFWNLNEVSRKSNKGVRLIGF